MIERATGKARALYEEGKQVGQEMKIHAREATTQTADRIRSATTQAIERVKEAVSEESAD